MRLSLNGRDLVYTNRSTGPHITLRIWGAADRLLGDGHSARWASPDALVFGPQTDGLLRVAERRTGWQVGQFNLVSGNTVAAAAHRVAIHRTDPVRIETSWKPATIPNAMSPAISDDGVWFAYALPDQVPNGQGGYRFQNGVSTLIVERSDGSGDRRDLWVGAPTEPRFGANTLAWETGGGKIAYVIDVNNPSSPVEDLAQELAGWRYFKPVPVWHAALGRLRLLLSADEGERSRVDLVTEESLRAGAPFGKALGFSAGSAYEHDARPLDRDWRICHHSPSGTVVDITWKGDGDEVLHPPTAGDEWPEPRVVPRVGWMTWFYSRGRYGDFEPGQNACLVSANDYSNDNVIPEDAHDKVADAINVEGAGFISSGDIPFAKSYWSKVVGVYVHEVGSPDQVRAAVTQAQATMDTFGLPRRQVIAIITPAESLNPAYAHCAPAIAPEIYLDAPGDSWEATHARAVDVVARVLQALPGTPLYLIPQAYDRNGNPAWTAKPSHLSAIAQACFDAYAIERVVGLWPFAYARPGGATTYPQLEDWYTTQADALTTPALPVDPEPEPEPEPEPGEDEMTEDDIRRYIDELPNNVLFGAYERFHNEVLPRDRPKDGIIKAGDDTDMWTGDVVTGGANAIFNRKYIAEYIIARHKQRNAEQASGDGYDKGIASYREATKDPQ